MIEIVKKLVLEKNALVISPHYNGIHSSIVYTHQGSISLEETVNEAMNQICTKFGSTLQGRIDATRNALRVRKKPPIIVSSDFRIVAIPYPSHIPGEDLWVLTENFKIVENGESSCKIILDDQLSLDIPRTRESVEKQRIRAIQVLHEFTYNSTFPWTGSMSQVMLLKGQ